MNKLYFLITFLIFNLTFSQENKLFKTEFKELTLQCSLIANSVIDKNKKSHFSEWYEGVNFEEKKKEFEKLETFIDNSKSEITFYLQLLSESELIYVINFYKKNTSNDLGILYIKFNNIVNNKVDDIKCLNEEVINQSKEINMSKKGEFIPPPPPPPSKFD